MVVAGERVPNGSHNPRSVNDARFASRKVNSCPFGRLARWREAAGVRSVHATTRKVCAGSNRVRGARGAMGGLATQGELVTVPLVSRERGTPHSTQTPSTTERQ